MRMPVGREPPPLGSPRLNEFLKNHSLLGGETRHFESIFFPLFQLDELGSGCLRPGHPVGNLGPIRQRNVTNPQKFQRKPFTDNTLETRKPFRGVANFWGAACFVCKNFRQAAQKAVSHCDRLSKNRLCRTRRIHTFGARELPPESSRAGKFG